ncbi:MAG: acetylornithine deacetylase [Pseudomonadota bacterium]
MNNIQKRHQAIDILEKLVSFQSISLQDNLALMMWIKNYLANFNIKASIIEHVAGKRVNLFARIGPDTRDAIMLSGHSDVVPTKGQDWDSDPFKLTLRDQRLYARGSADMKGFLACVLACVDDFCKAPLNHPIWIAISCDEEIGCVGVRPMIEYLKTQNLHPKLIIVGEPTLMKPVLAHKGKLSCLCHCKGLAGHSAYASELVSAIHLANDVITEIRHTQQKLIENIEAHDRRFPIACSTLNIGTIKGGKALNIVPEDCVFDFEIRHLPKNNPTDLLEPILQKAAFLNHQYQHLKNAVTIEVMNAYPGLEQKHDSKSVQLVKRLCASNEEHYVNFGTEAGLFQNMLASDCVVCGPGDIRVAHKSNEYIAVSQIDSCLTFLENLNKYATHG